MVNMKQHPRIDEMIEAYIELGNIWRVGERMGISGQNVHRHLKPYGIIPPAKLSQSKKDAVIKLYTEGFELGDGKIEALMASTGISRPSITRVARAAGLLDYNRKHSKKLREKTGARMKEYIATHGHPRGALGMKQSEEMKRNASIRSKQMWANMSEEQKDAYSARASINGKKAVLNRATASWKADWREIGGKRKYFRSRWEANYARYLEFLKLQGSIKEWQHEPKTFWFEGIKRGCMSYLPDFCVTENNGAEIYHEVKGWMDDRSKTKIARMARYHPKVTLLVIDSKAYRKLAAQVSKIVPEWE